MPYEKEIQTSQIGRYRLFRLFDGDRHSNLDYCTPLLHKQGLLAL